MNEDSPLSHEVRQFVDRGELVPDDLTVRVLLDKLGRAPENHGYSGALLDGFPRNRPQLDVLDQVIGERGDELAAVVHLAVPNDVLTARIEARSGDDSAFTSRKRNRCSTSGAGVASCSRLTAIRRWMR
jgi:adenylate kinase